MDELAEAAAVLAMAMDSESEEEMELEGKAGVIFGNTEHPRTFALSSKDLENQPDEPMSPLCGAAEKKASTGLLHTAQHAAHSAVHPLDLPVLTGFSGFATATC